MKSLPELAPYSDCTGCMLCADSCPRKAIHFAVDANGFWTPQIDSGLCIGCKRCEKQCRTVRQAELRPVSRQPYKGYANAEEVRQRSTSGGVFYALAEHAILSKAAVVYGAVCEGRRVCHKAAETPEALQKMQGSKYAQSDLQGVYQDVKVRLSEGRFVLFSGTPCQVQALHTYLGKEYDNLLTVDLVCHGVPSYKLVERHLAVNGGEGILHFRTKSFGWGKDSYTTIRKDGKPVIIRERFQNLFYRMFQSELAFRPNCYQCRFNQVRRAGDISIGDFWLVRRTAEYDPLGISTILPNTDKGHAFLVSCEGIRKEPITWEQALTNNPRLVTDRREYLETALSCHIGKLYKFLPAFIADRILGTIDSKRRPLNLLWRKYLAYRRAPARARYKAAWEQLMESLSSQTSSHT